MAKCVRNEMKKKCAKRKRAHSLHLQGDEFVHYVFMVLYPLGKLSQECCETLYTYTYFT